MASQHSSLAANAQMSVSFTIFKSGKWCYLIDGPSGCLSVAVVITH